MKKVLLVGVVWLLWAGSAQARPCEAWCAQRLHADNSTQTWQSPQRFGRGFGGADSLTIRITRRGRWLPEDFGSRNGERAACRGYVWRRHLQTQSDICGDPTRLILRYQGRGWFTIRYRASY